MKSEVSTYFLFAVLFSKGLPTVVLVSIVTSLKLGIGDFVIFSRYSISRRVILTDVFIFFSDTCFKRLLVRAILNF